MGRLNFSTCYRKAQNQVHRFYNCLPIRHSFIPVIKKIPILYFILSRIFRLLKGFSNLIGLSIEGIYSRLYWPGLIRELTPYDSDEFKDKIRLGNPFDGGYVVPSEIFSFIEVSYTYGVSTDISFELDMLKQKDILIRLYDHTVPTLPEQNQKLFFKQQGIAPSKYGPFDTFKNHLNQNGDSEKKIFLKMDIEGAEWDTIGQISDEFSKNIVAIVLEIHWLERIEELKNYLKTLEKINSKFTLIHIHGNNLSAVVHFGKKIIPEVCELTFINSSLIKSKNVMTAELPTKLDFPNDPLKKDIPLNFWR